MSREDMLSLFDEVEIEEDGPPVFEEVEVVDPNKITLHYYQQECIDASLNAIKRGVKRQLVCLPTASGKCVSHDTIVNANGFGTISSLARRISIEDQVEPHHLNVSSWPKGSDISTGLYYNGPSPTLQLTTSAGYELKALPRHPILVATESGPQWKKMEEISIGDFIAIYRGEPEWGEGLSIPIFETPVIGRTKKYKTPDKWDEDLSYLAGIIVGDGTVSAGLVNFYVITNPELLEVCIRIHKKHFGIDLKISDPSSRCSYLSVSSKYIRAFWEHVGIPKTTAIGKHIPWSILGTPKNIVRAFLQGLFDTDGSSLTNGYIEFSAKSELIAKQVQVVLLGFGIIGRRRIKFVNGNPYQIIDIDGVNAEKFYSEIGFRLKRKQDRRKLLKPFNTNWDIVPFASKIMYQAWIETKPHPFVDHKKWHSYDVWNIRKQQFSHFRLSSLVDKLPDFKNHPYWPIVESLADPRIYWSAVKVIEKADVVPCYDLVVPESHCFVANGIISHNTQILTHLFPQIPSPFPGATQTILIAHREELIDGLAYHAQRNNPGLTVAVEKAEREASPDADVIVASMQTLGRKDSKRIEKFNPKNVKVIVTDESHRATSAGYQNIFNYFGALDKDSHIINLGFTATPRRSDGVGLSAVYDEIVYYRSPIDLIEEKFLSSIRVRSIKTETDISSVTSSGNDFSITDLSNTVNNPERNHAIVDAYLEYCKDRKSTLVFCCDVQHTKDMNEVFVERGITAKYLLGETDSDERKIIFDDFKKQKYPVLVNCLVVSEGADVPAIDAILMCRPTKSVLLSVQMMGRGLRLSPETGKTNCLILDVCDVFKKKSVVTIPSLFGLDPEFEVDGEDIVKTYRQMEELVKDDINIHRAKSISQALKISSGDEFDPFSFQIDPSLREFTSNAWMRLGESDHFGIEIIGEGHIEISSDPLGAEIVFRGEDGSIKPLGTAHDTASAFRTADKWIKDKLPPQTQSIVSLKSQWNFLQPSPNQISLLNQLRIPIPTKPRVNGGPIEYNINRREASNMISKALNKNRKAKAKKALKKKGGGKIVSQLDYITVGKL